MCMTKGNAEMKTKVMNNNENVEKPILYIDMDGTIVDFVYAMNNEMTTEEKALYGDLPDDCPGLFSRMPEIKGATEAVLRLMEHFDVYILSTAPWNNPSAWMDKLVWIQTHFGEALKKRLIISHHKNLCHGAFLVDDRPNHGASEFNGEWIQIHSPKFPDWDSVVEYLESKL